MASVDATAGRADPAQGPVAPSRLRYSPSQHRWLAFKYQLHTEVTAWLFLLPFFIFFVVFLAIPVVEVFWWSFQSGSLTSPAQFVGFDNYLKLGGQVQAAAAIENTFLFALMSIPAELVFGMAIAMLLARVHRGGALYRFFIYFPSLVPGVVSGLIWVFLTNPDFGLFNTILGLFGLDPVVWLGDTFALPTLAGVDVWMNSGFWAIFFLAAIIGLPRDLNEAAEVDGATTWQRIRRIILPQLLRVILYAVVVATIFGLQVFDTVVVMTNGGPGTSTLTVVFVVWTYIFGTTGQVGYGATISVILLLGILVLTLIELRALRDRREGD